MTDESGDS